MDSSDGLVDGIVYWAHEITATEFSDEKELEKSKRRLIFLYTRGREV
jgi:hypothetical protein